MTGWGVWWFIQWTDKAEVPWRAQGEDSEQTDVSLPSWRELPGRDQPSRTDNIRNRKAGEHAVDSISRVRPQMSVRLLLGSSCWGDSVPKNASAYSHSHRNKDIRLQRKEDENRHGRGSWRVNESAGVEMQGREDRGKGWDVLHFCMGVLGAIRSCNFTNYVGTLIYQNIL